MKSVTLVHRSSRFIFKVPYPRHFETNPKHISNSNEAQVKNDHPSSNLGASMSTLTDETDTVEVKGMLKTVIHVIIVDTVTTTKTRTSKFSIAYFFGVVIVGIMLHWLMFMRYLPKAKRRMQMKLLILCAS